MYFDELWATSTVAWKTDSTWGHLWKSCVGWWGSTETDFARNCNVVWNPRTYMATPRFSIGHQISGECNFDPSCVDWFVECGSIYLSEHWGWNVNTGNLCKNHVQKDQGRRYPMELWCRRSLDFTKWKSNGSGISTYTANLSNCKLGSAFTAQYLCSEVWTWCVDPWDLTHFEWTIHPSFYWTSFWRRQRGSCSIDWWYQDGCQGHSCVYQCWKPVDHWWCIVCKMWATILGSTHSWYAIDSSQTFVSSVSGSPADIVHVMARTCEWMATWRDDQILTWFAGTLPWSNVDH